MYYFNFFIVFQIIFSFFNVSVIYFAKNKKLYIDIDNHISEFENNNDYSNFSTDIKLIALYSDYYKKNKIFNDNENNQTIRKDGKIFDKFEFEEFFHHINLSKIHGIYGFAIYYCWFCETKLIDNFLTIFLKNKNIDFHFFLIWKLSDSTCVDLSENNTEFQFKILVLEFFKNAMEYMKDSRYIRINQKAVLGIYKPNKIQNLKKTIKFLRQKAQKFGLGKLFILAFLHENSINHFAKLNSFDGYYEFFSIANLNHHIINQKKTYIYGEILYKLNKLKKRDLNLYQFSGNILDDNSEKNESFIIDYYSPEQFYMINKIIIDQVNKNNKSNMKYIFINSFNEWDKHLIFESNKIYGYSQINSLSKALFNLSYISNYYLINFNKTTKIAIQAHIYYEYLISDIVQKTNNIPVSFDLFISTDTKIKKDYINNYIFGKSKANNFEIKIFNNKGRDVLPLLLQLKKQVKKYKYICHIHTKKSNHIDFGEEWRNYLYNNLLGSEKIVSEVLTEFETNNRLGFIFPEIFYKVFIAYAKNILGANLKYMEAILTRIRPYLKLSIKNLDYPMGNMFWAKVKSIHQIFHLDLKEQIPIENKQLDGTWMHGIERIWVYLVKYNGFYYKKIFKHI